MVDYESRCRTRHLLNGFFLNIINFHFFIAAAFWVIGCQRTGLLENPVRQFTSFRLHNYVRAGDSFCVKPPVITGSDFECQLFILIIILSDINMKTVRWDIMERPAGDFDLFTGRPMLFYKTVFRQLLLNLCQIFLLQRNIQWSADWFQMFDFLLCFLYKLWKRLIGPFQLIIFIKKFLRIFTGRKLWIQRDFNRFICIIIDAFQFLFPAAQLVSISV